MARLTVEDEIDILADLRDRMKDIDTNCKTALRSLVPKSVQDKLDAEAMRFDQQRKELKKKLDEQEKKVKTAVLKVGERVMTDRLDCRYVAGRVSWNDDKLQGFALVHPEINAARSVGDPSVSIYEVKEK